jgi:hypothetical protein
LASPPSRVRQRARPGRDGSVRLALDITTEAEAVTTFTAWLETEDWVVGPGPDKWLNLYTDRGDERPSVDARSISS